jgi:H+/Cl- antiporter ClcA
LLLFEWKPRGVVPVALARAAAGAARCYILRTGSLFSVTPFTAIVFAIELTHDVNLLLPLLIALMLAYAFTTVSPKRS